MKGVIVMAAFILLIVGIMFALPTPFEHQGLTLDQTHENTPESVALQLAEHNELTDDSNTADNHFVITGATWFDGQVWHQQKPLTVINGRVDLSTDLSEVAIELPRFDYSGKYILPGFIDAHTHTWGNALKQAVQFGVTTELDMFTQPEFITTATFNQSDTHDRQQADFFSSGILATSEGGHGTEYGINIPTLSSPDQALDFVKQRLAEGSNYIKIVYIHANRQTPFTSISRDTLIALVNAAHQMNVMALVHVSDYESAYHAVSAGADGLVHVFYDKQVTPKLLSLMQENRTFVIPTLSVIASMASDTGVGFLNPDSPLKNHVTPAIENQLNQSFESHSFGKSVLAIAFKNVKMMHQAGIDILVGTDAPNPGTAHGISIFKEMQLLQKAGMPPNDILRAATSVPGKYFPIQKRGQLIDGARADLIVLSKQPLETINNTQYIDAVYKNGFKITSNITNSSTQRLANEFATFKADLTSQSNAHRFFATSDNMFQGNSNAILQWQNEGCDSVGSAIIKGKIGDAFPYPWAGAMVTFSQNMEQSVDLSSKFQRMMFNVKGTPGQYRLLVFTQGLQRPQEVSFSITGTKPSCEQVSIEF